MPVNSPFLPPIPQSTAEIASTLFGEMYMYIRLGKQINRIFFELAKIADDNPNKLPAENDLLFSLLTVCQFVEGLSDQQTVESIRKRVDLKYALHLPLNYPSFDPRRLCIFRQQIFHNPDRQEAFQGLVDRLAAFGLVQAGEAESVPAEQLLEAICTLDRLEVVIEAMYLALETLAVANPEWLRQIMRPHWYERFSRRMHPTGDQAIDPRWMAIANQIGEDIQYLLEKIEQAEDTSLASLPEVQHLKKVKLEQFEKLDQSDLQSSKFQFNPHGCASCIRHTGKLRI